MVHSLIFYSCLRGLKCKDTLTSIEFLNAVSRKICDFLNAFPSPLSFSFGRRGQGEETPETDFYNDSKATIYGNPFRYEAKMSGDGKPRGISIIGNQTVSADSPIKAKMELERRWFWLPA
jgi:hypothetical protein